MLVCVCDANVFKDSLDSHTYSWVSPKMREKLLLRNATGTAVSLCLSTVSRIILSLRCCRSASDW